MKVRLFSSLSFKIGLAVVVIEVAALALLGCFYVQRFSAQVDEALHAALAMPGDLMSQGVLNMNVASERPALELLVGPELVELMVISADGQIFHSTNPDMVGGTIADLPLFKVEWIEAAKHVPVVEQIQRGSDTFLIRVSPVSAGMGRAAFLFVYVKMKTTGAQREKSRLQEFFVVGSLATVVATSLALLVFIRYFITRRLSKMADAVDRVAAGDLNVRVDEHLSRDEVGQAQRGVDHMTERLQRTIGSLESTVTQLHEAQRLIATQNSFREAIIKQASEGICVFSHTDTAPNIRFFVWNDAMERITGRTIEEVNVLGWPALMRTGPGRGGDFTDRLASLWKGDHFHAEEWGMIDNAGHAHTILISTAALPPHNDREQCVALLSDITGLKTAESERIKLEREVAHAQKLKSLGILAGGIAHDFNNILTAILGHTDLALLDERDGRPIRDDLKEIERATLRAADLARQMLAYSGRGRFVLTDVALNELVQQMYQLLSASISKKVVLKLELAENLPTFSGDGTQITQIIMNLIMNAAEAMDGGSGTVTVRSGVRDCDAEFLGSANHASSAEDEQPPKAGRYVFIEVADTGCGMDAATVERIFEPFFTTKFTGRGLGLSVVLGIIRGHHGVLHVESTKGVGSTIRVYFPISPTGETADRKTDKEAHAPKSLTDIDKPNRLILMADDEEQIRVLGSQMIRQLGHRVLVAADGAEAVEIFAAHAPEIGCVILDVTMPRLDGEAAFDEIRKIAPHVPIILTSGYSEQSITERFAGKNLAGFLPKPFTLATLASRIQQALNRHEPPAPTTADI